MRRRSHLFLLLFWLFGCIHPRPVHPPISRTDVFPGFKDTEPLISLRSSVKHSLEALSRHDDGTRVSLGSQSFLVKDLRETLDSFLFLLEGTEGTAQLNMRIPGAFDLYEVFEPVLFTGYYEPLLEGSRVRTERFRYPLYRRPDDLTVRDNAFCPGCFLFLRDRPSYYTREEIDAGKVLEGRNLELLFLKDPVENFFLHVEGAGTIQLPDGSLAHVQYDGSNNRPYTPIGKLLVREAKLLPDEASLRGIKEYLHRRPEERERIMNRNQRYIFFKITDTGPAGVDDIPLTPLRSLATDPAVIPAGTLLYLVTDFPVFDAQGNPAGVKEQANFAVSQDVGKAIQGANRADIFFGSGPRAETAAGHLKSRGKLYILVRKKGTR